MTEKEIVQADEKRRTRMADLTEAVLNAKRVFDFAICRKEEADSLANSASCEVSNALTVLENAKKALVEFLKYSN